VNLHQFEIETCHGKVSDPTERNVPTSAIASEEDGRIYMCFVENLAKRHPGT
jgi:hypothetical protein